MNFSLYNTAMQIVWLNMSYFANARPLFDFILVFRVFRTRDETEIHRRGEGHNTGHCQKGHWPKIEQRGEAKQDK